MVNVPAILKNSECYSLSSADINQDFDILVSLPDKYYEDNATYPVLITLDANASFFTVAEQVKILTRDIMLPTLPMIVIGISYSEPMREYGYNVLRCRDYTPPGCTLFPNAEDFGIPKHMCGGGDLFLEFLENQVLPSIRSRYRMASDKVGLFGYSYGGLFAAYALFTRSPSFDTYIIGSMGAVHENDIIFKTEQQCADTGTVLPARVLFTYAIGERIGHIGIYNMIVRNCMKMAEILECRKYEGLQWSIKETAGDTHMTGYVPSLYTGLGTFYSQKRQ